MDNNSDRALSFSCIRNSLLWIAYPPAHISGLAMPYLHIPADAMYCFFPNFYDAAVSSSVIFASWGPPCFLIAFTLSLIVEMAYN